MAHMNFDKAITHFATANINAKRDGQDALADLAAGLQRLAEALHHDVDQILRTLQTLEGKKKP
ncbi:MAG: hypothetical protein ACM3ZT_11225 [Bacillota bacterium]